MQGYAAVVAAAYTRALLEMIPSRIPAGECKCETISDSIDSRRRNL